MFLKTCWETKLWQNNFCYQNIFENSFTSWRQICGYNSTRKWLNIIAQAVRVGDLLDLITCYGRITNFVFAAMFPEVIGKRETCIDGKQNVSTCNIVTPSWPVH